MTQALLHAMLVQVAVFVAVAVLISSGAAGWLLQRAPKRVRQWAKVSPRWVLWLVFLTGAGLMAFSLGLWMRPG